MRKLNPSQFTPVSRRDPSGIESSIRYETRDFYLACYLRCQGYELLNLRAEGQRKVFVFRDRETRRDDVLAFYSDRATVGPQRFSTVVKETKALLHNA